MNGVVLNRGLDGPLMQPGEELALIQELTEILVVLYAKDERECDMLIEMLGLDHTPEDIRLPLATGFDDRARAAQRRRKFVYRTP